MKASLKSIIIIGILLIGGISTTGCGNKVSEEANLQPGETPQKTDTSTKPDTISDSIDSRVLLDSINNINTRLENLNLIINQKNTEEYNNRSSIKEIGFLILISWGIAAIALVLSILGWHKAKVAIARAGRHRQEIEDLKSAIKESEGCLMNVSRNNDNTSSVLARRYYDELSSQIFRIEQKLEHYVEHQPQNIPTGERNVGTDISRSIPSNEQYGYFGLPSKKSETEAYFRRLEETRDSESRFYVVVKNGIAEFRPLNGTPYLNDLRSSDTIKMALDIQGCVPSAPVDMTVIRPGEAKLEEGRWVIIKNAVIELS